MANKELDKLNLQFTDKACATIILASGGYPESYEKGKPITGAYEITESLVFHAGTRIHHSQLYTNGGRVLAITSFGDTLEKAVLTSIANAERIDFEGRYYRRDIGFDVL